jgi:hypothetical protein
MNPLRLLAASAVLGLWTFSTTAAPLNPEGRRGPHRGNRHRQRCRGFLRIRGQRAATATLLDLGKSSPKAVFTAVINGDNRAKFGTPEISLRGKRICVTGQIRGYQGKPEIVPTETRLGPMRKALKFTGGQIKLD